MKTIQVRQPLARKSGLSNPPWFEDDNAVFSVDAFSYLRMKKFADRNSDTGEVTEWKVMEVSDKYGPLTARFQTLTGKGCVGRWRGPFYIRDIALNHWLYIEYMKSSGIPFPEVHAPIPLQQLHFPPKPKSTKRKAPSSPDQTSSKSTSSRQGTLEARKRPVPAGTTDTVESTQGAMEVEAG